MVWTVDTWVLATANGEPTALETVACQGFLLSLLADDSVALSPVAEHEYHRSALVRDKEGYQTFALWWFAQIVKRLVYPPAGGEAEAGLARALRESLPPGVTHFDPDDIPFVVLCYRTDDRHLISGDIGEGDFCEALTAWLHADYTICFHDLQYSEPYHGARHACTRPDEC